MNSRLTRKDYESILKYYDIKHNANMSYDKIKEKATGILSDKLCRCIKKVKSSRNNTESNRIAICKKSILHGKNITDTGFSCRKKTINLRRRTAKPVKTKRKSSSVRR